MNSDTIKSLRNQLDDLYRVHQNLMSDFVRATEQDEREVGVMAEIDKRLISMDNHMIDVFKLLKELADE